MINLLTPLTSVHSFCGHNLQCLERARASLEIFLILTDAKTLLLELCRSRIGFLPAQSIAKPTCMMNTMAPVRVKSQ